MTQRPEIHEYLSAEELARLETEHYLKFLAIDAEEPPLLYKRHWTTDAWVRIKHEKTFMDVPTYLMIRVQMRPEETECEHLLAYICACQVAGVEW